MAWHPVAAMVVVTLYVYNPGELCTVWVSLLPVPPVFQRWVHPAALGVYMDTVLDEWGKQMVWGSGEEMRATGTGAASTVKYAMPLQPMPSVTSTLYGPAVLTSTGDPDKFGPLGGVQS